MSSNLLTKSPANHTYPALKSGDRVARTSVRNANLSMWSTWFQKSIQCMGCSCSSRFKSLDQQADPHPDPPVLWHCTHERPGSRRRASVMEIGRQKKTGIILEGAILQVPNLRRVQ